MAKEGRRKMMSQTAKMIYQQANVAAMIAGKLSKSKGLKHEVHKVATGFQVVAIKKLPDYVPPAKPLPVQKPAMFTQNQGGTSGKSWTGVEFVILDMKFRGESKVYVDAWTANGKQISF